MDGPFPIIIKTLPDPTPCILYMSLGLSGGFVTCFTNVLIGRCVTTGASTLGCIDAEGACVLTIGV